MATPAKLRLPSEHSGDSRVEWIEQERQIESNQSQESGFASDASQQAQSISSPKTAKNTQIHDTYQQTDDTVYLSCPSTSYGSSDNSADSNSDDCTITPDDALVIFPDGTMRRIQAQQIGQLRLYGKEMSDQEERLLAGTLSKTLKRKNEKS